MFKTKFKIIFLAIIFLGLFGLAKSSLAVTDIIPTNRQIDWSQSGIPGGIPTTRTQSGSTIQASAYGNGSSDATSGIQTALNNAAVNTYVLLGAGTFRINSSLSIPSNITLRGSGADQTILKTYGDQAGAIMMGDITIPYQPSYKAIASGSTAGSTSIVVSSASGISVGSYLLITETDNASVGVTSTGTEGACTWCDDGGGGVRDRGQVVEVTSVNGTTIGFSPGLYSAYTNSPVFIPFTAQAKYAGVEDLEIYANNTGYAAMITMNQAAYSWVKGVSINFTDADIIDANYSYRDEIRNSYFHDAYLHTSGTSDSDVDLMNKTSGTLVENNIFSREHASLMLEWGAAGNVIAYNYMFGNFDTNATNVLMASVDYHGAHPQYNLIEGNVLPQIYPDPVWGSEGPETFYRNYASGTTQICSPVGDTRAAINCSGSNGHWTNQANFGLNIGQYSYDINLVGDIAGSAQLHSQMTEDAIVASPQTRDGYSNTGYDVDIGYGEPGDSTGPFSSLANNTVYQNALIHGVYTNADDNITWANGVTHTLPASLYLTSKPSYWGSVPWPVIGPDVTGGTGPGGHAYAIPAQNCYNNGSFDSNGYLIFNEANCYTAASGDTTPPAAPSGLSVL